MAAYADARVDFRGRTRSLERMGVSKVQGDVTSLTINTPTTKTAKVETEFWTLCMVAGKDFGTDWGAWNSWWKKNRGEFAFPDLDKK